MLQYNQKGLIVPETIILSTLQEFGDEFSDKTNEGRRSELFDKYRLYCKDIKQVCENRAITQWVDGSYVTQSRNPSDIDLVNFIDFDIAKVKENELKKFIYPQSLETYEIDAYIIIVYPETSESNFITQSDRSYWIDRFGKTKPTRQKKRIPKGFLEIIV